MNYTMNINGLEVKATFDDTCIQEILLPLLRKLTTIQKQKNKRIVVFLAAPPGTGKSTLAAFLADLAIQNGLTPISVLGMDGFHHYQDYLLSHTIIKDGKEVNMVSIKGAPITFDLPLLKQRIIDVSRGNVCGWPIYDRNIHNPIEDMIQVEGDIILIEGNYLLLDENGWEELRNYADYTIAITAKKEDLRTRLIYRKAQGMPMHQAIHFVDSSDLVNVEYVLNHTKGANLTLNMIGDGLFEMK